MGAMAVARLRAGVASSWFVIISFFVVAAFCGRPDLNDLKQEYEEHIFKSNNYTGYEFCIYDGLMCNRADEYCSPVSESCEPAFTAKDFKNEDEKVTYCVDLANNIKSRRIPSYKKDACIYFLGKRSIESPSSLENFKDSDISCGYELCIYDGSQCPRSSMYCSPSKKTCEQVFDKDEFKSEVEKEQKCRELVRDEQTESWKKDACIYILGKNVAMNERQKEDNSPKDHSAVLYIILTLVLLLVIGLVVLGVVIIRWWKRRTRTKNRRGGEQGGGDDDIPLRDNQALAQGRNASNARPPVANNDNDINEPRNRELAENEQNERNALAQDLERQPNVDNLGEVDQPQGQQRNGQREAHPGGEDPNGQHGDGEVDAQQAPDRQGGGDNRGAEGDIRPNEQGRPAVELEA